MPGDILVIKQDEQIPADVIILNTSEEKGVCYIETKSLDGETNLKMKNAEPHLQSHFKSESAIVEHGKWDGEILCEQPNNAIYKFEGNMKLWFHEDDKGTEEKSISLNADNILLRGSTLRNTEKVYGVVVFTGHDTKVMRNLPQAKFKFSTLEKVTNQAIVIVMAFSVAFSAFGSIIGSTLNAWASTPT